MGRKRKKRLTKNFLVVLGIPAVFVPGLILAAILGWNWQGDLGKLAGRGGFYRSGQLFPKKAMVREVIDGDTLELKSGRIVRMVGIDAPNRGDDFYGQALEYTIKFSEEKEVELEYGHYQDDKFGRLLAYIWVSCTTQKGCQDGRLMLNKGLVGEGLARIVVYSKRKKLKYLEELFEAQEEAKEKGLGIWNGVE